MSYLDLRPPVLGEGLVGSFRVVLRFRDQLIEYSLNVPPNLWVSVRIGFLVVSDRLDQVELLLC